MHAQVLSAQHEHAAKQAMYGFPESGGHGLMSTEMQVSQCSTACCELAHL